MQKSGFELKIASLDTDGGKIGERDGRGEERDEGRDSEIPFEVKKLLPQVIVSTECKGLSTSIIKLDIQCSAKKN